MFPTEFTQNKVGNVHRTKHFWRVRLTVATKQHS